MRYTYFLLALVVLALGGYQVWQATRSPEEKIESKLEAAQDAFNDSRLGPCMDLFERGFFEGSKGYSYDNIQSAITYAFFREVDPTTKEFLYRVSIGEVGIEVVDAKAQVAFLVELSERSGEEWSLKWRFRFSGEMVETESNGWQLVKGSQETLEGARPR